jgi:hypothetical protein
MNAPSMKEEPKKRQAVWLNGMLLLSVFFAFSGSFSCEGKALPPVCFYGTSIVQGARACPAGTPYPAILGRRLHRPVLNLGFNGQGRMEPELAAILAELKVAA